MRDAQGRVRSRVRRCGGGNGEWLDGEGACVFSKKAGRKKRKEGAFRKKVHNFSFNLSRFSRNQAFFTQNIWPFETKSLLLHLINTTSFHSAALRRLYSAKSRCCPNHPTQTLFNLQNWRDFAISQPLGTDKKRYVPARDASSRDHDEILSKLPNPMFMQYTIIFCCIALALTIHELGHLSCRATVQHEDKEPQYL